MAYRTGNRPKKSFRESGMYLVNVTLTPDLDKFLTSIGQESRDRGGRFLPKTAIMRSLIRLLQALHHKGKLDLDGVGSEDELVQRLKRALGKK